MQVEYREGIQETVKSSIEFEDTVAGRPLYFNLTMKLEPLDLENDADVEVIFDF